MRQQGQVMVGWQMLPSCSLTSISAGLQVPIPGHRMRLMRAGAEAGLGSEPLLFREVKIGSLVVEGACQKRAAGGLEGDVQLLSGPRPLTADSRGGCRLTVPGVVLAAALQVRPQVSTPGTVSMRETVMVAR